MGMNQITEKLEQQIALLSERSKGSDVLLDEVTRASEAMATLAAQLQLLGYRSSPTD